MNNAFLSLMGLISLGLIAVGILSFIYGFFTKGFRRMGKGILMAIIGAILLGISALGGIITSPR